MSILLDTVPLRSTTEFPKRIVVTIMDEARSRIASRLWDLFPYRRLSALGRKWTFEKLTYHSRRSQNKSW